MKSSLALIAVIAFITLFTSPAYGMTAMGDEEMAKINGQGIAVALEDFRLQAQPTSFTWLLGEPTAGTGTSFRRGDLRYFGLSISATGASGGSGFAGEDAPFGWTSPIGPTNGVDIAPFDNPYLLRVFDHTEMNHNGVDETITALELIGPSRTPRYRWAFWGENVVSNANCTATEQTDACFGDIGVLQSQTVIHGSPTSPDQRGLNEQGPILRMMRTSAAGGDPSIGFIYHSRLKGDFRFSLAQNGVSPEGVPLFNNGNGTGENGSSAPGMKFKNVEAFLPLGQLNYQTIRLDDTVPGRNPTLSTDGDFVIELTRIPNNPNVYNDFYGFPSGNSNTNLGYERGNRSERYYETHGFVRWGDPATANTIDTTQDGIYFTAPAGTTFTASAQTNNSAAEGNNSVSYSAPGRTFANLGDARVEGLLVQHLKITTLGAGGN